MTNEHQAYADPRHPDHPARMEGEAIDPVCGMVVDPTRAEHRLDLDGQAHYFCSAGCKAKFAADPAHFLAGAQRAPAVEVPAGTIYTCPMHPQIRQAGPGSCPICGDRKSVV